MTPDRMFHYLMAALAVVCGALAAFFVIAGIVQHNEAYGVFSGAVLASGSIMATLVAVFQ